MDRAAQQAPVEGAVIKEDVAGPSLIEKGVGKRLAVVDILLQNPHHENGQGGVDDIEGGDKDGVIHRLQG